MNTKTKGWRFQSAEGCISKVVTDQSNITIYVGSTQISDAFHAAIAEKESMIIGSSLVRCYKSPIDFSEIQSASIFSSSSRYVMTQYFSVFIFTSQRIFSQQVNEDFSV